MVRDPRKGLPDDPSQTRGRKSGSAPRDETGPSQPDAGEEGTRDTAGQSSATREDAADFIHELATSMRKMAEQANMPFLAYLLDLAAEEAGARARGRR